MAERIGQILIRKGKITPEQLREALRTQQFFGGYLGSHLINLGFIDEATLGETLAEIFNVPHAPFEVLRTAPRDVIALLPPALVQRFRVVPVKTEGNRLFLVMLNPKDTVAAGEVSIITGLNVVPLVAPEFRIVQALEKHYKIRREAPAAIPVAIEADDFLPARAAVKPGTAKAAGNGVGSAPSSGPEGSPSGAAASTPGPELGFDGHPIDAAVVPELGLGWSRTHPEGSGASEPPQTLQDWMESDDRPARRPQREFEAPQPPPSPAAGPPRATDRGGLVPPARERGADPAQGHAGPLRAPAPSSLGLSSRSTPEAGGRTISELPASGAFVGAAAHGDLERLKSTLSSALTRDDIGSELLAVISGRFRRTAIFAVRQDQILGWLGLGPGVDPDRLARIAVPLDRPSVFAPVAASSATYIGPLPAGQDCTGFFEQFGAPTPNAILLIPITVRERLVALAYADNQADPLGPVDLSVWKRLAQIVGAAFEIQVLRRRLLML